MIWTRSESLAMALQSCTKCLGLGMVPKRQDERVCNCVLRAIFRACYSQFRKCSVAEPYMAQLSAERGANSNLRYSYRNQEFVADFLLVSYRALGGRDTLQGRLFRYHYLLGADWKLCTRKLGNMDRGEFFHEVYRIEQRLGRAYREVEPYALFPLDEYFGGRVRAARTATPVVAIDDKRRAVRAPLKKIAA